MWFYFFSFSFVLKHYQGWDRNGLLPSPSHSLSVNDPLAGMLPNPVQVLLLVPPGWQQQPLSMVKLIHAHPAGSRSHFWIDPGAGCFFYKTNCCHRAKVTFAPSCLARTGEKSVGTGGGKLSWWGVSEWILLPWGLSCRSGDSCLPLAFCIIVKC